MPSQRKWILPVCLWAVGFVFVIVIWSALFPAEPSYQGKPLSAWAQQYGSNHWSSSGKQAAKEAETAIRQIGTNGIPFLLSLVDVGESPLRKRINALVPQRWHKVLGLVDQSGNIRRVGAYGLAALGTNAAPAVPALMEIAERHPDEDGRYIAGFALRCLGPTAEPAIPLLIQRLTNSVRIIRDDAALGLAQIGRRPDLAVPALIQYLEAVKGLSGWEVPGAIAALGRFGTNARPAVPLMLSLLNHSDPEVRREVTNRLVNIAPELIGEIGYSQEIAIQNAFMVLKVGADSHQDFDMPGNIAVLGWFGTNSQVAVPLLIQLLTNSDLRVRTATTNWLPRIDPEAAAKVGIDPVRNR